MTPVIGITAKQPSTPQLKAKLSHYLDAIHRQGAKSVLLNPQTSPLSLKGMDGLILTGGDDVDPTLYGQSVQNCTALDSERDTYEINLTRLALQWQLPILGICRGLQVMNVALGGKLIQHVDGHIINHHDDPLWLQHDVQLTAYSRLAGIFQRSLLTVNSRHHQVIDSQHVGKGLRVTALSFDNEPLIEAIEAMDHPWAIGVQWHPERAHEVPAEQALLFQHFLSATQSTRPRKTAKSLLARQAAFAR